MDSAEVLFPRLVRAHRAVLALLLASAAGAAAVALFAWIGTADRARPAACVRALG